MRIGIACYPTPGGSGVIASELALGLADRGHEVHVVSYAVPFRLRRFHRGVQVHVVEVSSYPLFKYPPYTLSLATKLVDVATAHGLDVIHAHYAVPHAVSGLLAQQILGAGAPALITTLHGTDITLVGADPSFGRVVRFALESSGAVTAVSNYLRQRTIQEFAIERPIEVIYNFVSTTRCRGATNGSMRACWAGAGEKIVLHASNFRPVKRVRDVVRIFATVREKLPAKLLLVGEGPERPAAEALVRELGVREDVHFLGEVDYLEGILGSVDVCLLPSEEESFGLVALEAMSCEVPVVASRVGGLPEVLLDGETGFLCPIGDVAAMAEAAVALLSDEERRRRMGRQAREHAVENFEAAQLIPRYEKLYESARAGRL